MAAKRKRSLRSDRVIKRPQGGQEKWRPDNVEICRSMARLGMTKFEIAQALGIRRETLWAWENKHPGLSNVLRAAAEEADMRVETSMYERAVGYSYHSNKVYHYKGEPVIIPVVEHVPPDPQSGIFWLKNRQPDRWKDRMEVQHSHLFNFVGMLPSEEEWRKQYLANPEPLVIESKVPVVEEDKGDE